MGRADGDLLLDLAELPGLAQRLAAARTAVDSLLWDREVRRRSSEVAAESIVRGAWANAWVEGAQVSVDRVRDGSVLDGSPLGRVLAGVLTLHAELPSLVPVFSRAPAQALARMHALVASGVSGADDLGRPRRADPDDPLRIGMIPPSAEVAPRLAALFEQVVSSEAPGVLVAAVAHAEVALLRPFSWGSGLVARAVPRLVLAARGVDPSMLGVPEVGLRSIPRPAYVRSLRGYGAGTPEGVAEFLGMIAGAVATGAEEPSAWIRAGG